ncbi:hypothetical protein GCM10027296_22160 [Chitinimonas naiadis]
MTLLTALSLALGGIYLSRLPGSIAAIWYANAAVAVLLQLRPLRETVLLLPLVAAGYVIASLIYGDSFVLALNFLPGNLCEIALSSYLLRRHGYSAECLFDPVLLVRTLLLVVVLPSIVGAIIGAPLLAVYGLASFDKLFVSWVLGSSIGGLAVLPLGLVYLTQGAAGLRSALLKIELLPLLLFALAVSVYAPVSLPFPYVYISAALVLVALAGQFSAIAVTLPCTSLTLGILIALGQFQPIPSINAWGEVLFYLPFAIAMLPPLLIAAALQRVQQANLQLAEREHNFRTLYTNTPVMMHSIDTEGRLISVSEAWLARLGYQRDEVLGRQSVEFLTPQSLRYAKEVVIPAFHRDGQVKDVEYQMVTRSGEIFDVRLSAIWERDKAGKPIRTLAVLTETTEEKRLARSQAEDGERLAAILAGTDAGTWEWNIQTGEVRFNDRWLDIVGYLPGVLPAPNDIQFWESLVHPDDRAGAAATLARHLAGDAPQYHVEVRMRHKAGYWVHVLNRGKVMRWTDDGLPEWMYGTLLDISEMKRAQQAAEEGQFFLERTGQIAGVGAWSVDLIENRVHWSSQTCRIHDLPVGYQPSLQEGLRFYAPEARPAIEQAVEMAITQQARWDLELPLITAAGRDIWVRSVGEVELDAAGKPVRLMGAFQDITSRKAAETQLNHLNALLNDVLQSASEIAIIATDLHGVIRIFNRGAEHMLGYEAAELVDLRSLLVLHEPKEIEERAKELSGELGTPITGFRVLSQLPLLGQIETREWSWLRKRGARVPVSLVMNAMRGRDGAVTGYLAIATDITSEQKHRQALTAARDQLLMAAEVAELGIWTWALADNSLQWNDRMFEFYDQPLSLRATGLNYDHWRSRVHADDVAAAEASLLAAVDGQGKYDPILRVVRRDGSIRFIQAGAQIERDELGLAVRVTGINRDITNQLQLESNLRLAKEQADAASEAKSSFLANMSHEIRTPMNAVLGMLQLVQRTQLSARQQDYIDKAEGAAKSLLGILNDILDFSKVDAGKMLLDIHPFDIEQLMRDLAVVLSGNQHGKQVEVLFDLDPVMPRHLLGDRLRLQQVLINLAANALKFTLKGEVVVTIRCIESIGKRVRMTFSVRDSGIGIAPDQLQGIFEGFKQAEASTTRRFGGTGLGLAISRRLVELMGGTLSVRSELGGGSEFSFQLDFDIAEDSASLSMHTPNSRPLNVLVVDDNVAAREVISHIAQAEGWNVLEAQGGEAAFFQLAAARLAGRPIDIVLLDWQMPGEDGLQIARDIRSSSWESKPPAVIMITAYGRDVLAEAQLRVDVPFIEFLTKPITPVQLNGAVARAISGVQIVHQRTEEPRRPQRLSGLQLLIVEDNALNRQVVSELLGAEGALITLACGGLEGVDIVLRHPDRFDLIIMDVQMPDIDGLEATRRIRAVPACRTVPILAMTANASAADRQVCLDAGMDEHIGKPIDLEATVAVICSLTGRESRPLSRVEKAANPSGRRSPDDCLDSALARLGGDTQLYASILSALSLDCERLIASAEVGRAKADWKQVAMDMHTLKGNASTAGAYSLARYAAEIEQQVRQQPSVAVGEDALMRLRELARQSHTALLNALQQRDDYLPLPQAVDTGRLTTDKEVLHSLLTLLDSKNMQALQVADELARSVDQIEDPALMAVCARVNALDFPAAAIALREWLGARSPEQS